MRETLAELSRAVNAIDERLAKDLTERGMFILDGVLSASESARFRREIDDREARFTAARVGRAEGTLSAPEIRRDRTEWWNFSAPTDTQALLLPLFEELRTVANRTLYLGLDELEGHYAIYDPGAFYSRHLDCFRSDSKRTLSIVLFLNEADWAEADGGALAWEDRAGEHRVFPLGGRLVVFLSAEVPHEVEITHRRRCSFAGWFKSR